MKTNNSFKAPVYKVGISSLGIVIPKGFCEVYDIADGKEVTFEIKKVEDGKEKK